MPNTLRQQRVAELVREELADILARRVGDPRVSLVSVTDVQVTADLTLARVYVTVIGDAEARDQALKGLEHAKPFIRRELAHRVELRQVPDLVFKIDTAVDRGNRVEELLRQIHEEQKDQTDSPS